MARYNPQTGLFTTTGTPLTSRVTGFTATLLQNGSVLIAGGSTNLTCYYNVNQVSSQDITANAEIYTPATGKFTVAGTLNAARQDHSAVLLSTGDVLITGGTDDLQNGLTSAELYSPSSNTFSYTGPLNVARALHTSNVLSNGLVLIAGGNNPVGGTGGTRTPLTSAELYDPLAAKFSTTISLNTARATPSSVLLPNGSLLETGGTGTGSTPALASLETYAPPTVTGWVNPKYIVVGVTYAPPGSTSTAVYTNSVTQGNTTTIANSFSNDVGVSVSISNGIMVGGLVTKGSFTYTASSSTDYTQGTMSSNAVTLMKQTTFAQTQHGVPDSLNPVNHDYDLVWLWLNPEAVFTVDPDHPTSLVWNGYQFDPNDIPTQDIYPVLVGNLNGDIAMDVSVQTVLSRAWAKNQTWPAGEGPALTPTDYGIILQADPFADCQYPNTTQGYTSCYFPQNDTVGSNFGPPPPPISADGRFTIAPTSEDIPYVVGGSSTGYTETTTNTTTQTNQSNHSFKQAFGIDTQFKLSTASLGFFASTLTIDTKYSQTLDWTHSFQQALTMTTSNTSALSITPPPCTNGVCPPYAGPGEFLVYQDNLYGTFMLFPVN
jgi:hypothetical protein